MKIPAHLNEPYISLYYSGNLAKYHVPRHRPMRGLQGVLPPRRNCPVHRAQGQPLSELPSGLPQSTGNGRARGLRSGGCSHPEDRRFGLETELGAQHLRAHQQEERPIGEPTDASGPGTGYRKSDRSQGKRQLDAKETDGSTGRRQGRSSEEAEDRVRGRRHKHSQLR